MSLIAFPALLLRSSRTEHFRRFGSDQHDGRHVGTIFHKNPAHGQDSLAGFLVPKQIYKKAQSTPQTFVLNQPVGLQQPHGTLDFSLHFEPFSFQNCAPLHCSQRPGPDVDRPAKGLFDFQFDFVIQVVRDETQFVDPVPAAQLQKPGGFPHDLPFLLSALHRQHCLAVNDRGRLIGQRCLGGAAHQALLASAGQQMADASCGGLIVLDGRVEAGCKFSVIRAVTPSPGANSTTASDDWIASDSSNRRVRFNPPGRNTCLPSRASNQCPGILLAGNSDPGKAI